MLYILVLSGILIILFFIIKKRPATLEQVSALSKTKPRVSYYKNEIFIVNDLGSYEDVEIEPVIPLSGEIPEIIIYEGDTKICTYKIHKKNSGINPDGTFLHASVRVNSNSSVQIDGFLSRSLARYDKDNDEGIRFQPFFLSDRSNINEQLKRQGTFARGLHYSGLISSGNIRLVCICDVCKESFSLDFIHAGFSELQYFYSENSKDILFVRYGEIENIPTQLQDGVNEMLLSEIESQLPMGEYGSFKYYNGLNCPKCNSVYIDFQNHKELRSVEYYAHYHLNTTPVYFNAPQPPHA